MIIRSQSQWRSTRQEGRKKALRAIEFKICDKRRIKKKNWRQLPSLNKTRPKKWPSMEAAAQRDRMTISELNSYNHLLSIRKPSLLQRNDDQFNHQAVAQQLLSCKNSLSDWHKYFAHVSCRNHIDQTKRDICKEGYTSQKKQRSRKKKKETEIQQNKFPAVKIENYARSIGKWSNSSKMKFFSGIAPADAKNNRTGVRT